MTSVGDPIELRAAACEMRARGLTDVEIGVALAIGPTAVARLSMATSVEAAALHARAWRRSAAGQSFLEQEPGQ